jgi:quinol monooxygenase YgiN
VSATKFEVVATYTTLTGREADVLANLRALAQASRGEPGNLRYEYFQGIEDPSRIVILETYRAAEDFDAHRQTPHFQRLGTDTIIPLLQNRTVSTFESSVDYGHTAAFRASPTEPLENGDHIVVAHH